MFLYRIILILCLAGPAIPSMAVMVPPFSGDPATELYRKGEQHMLRGELDDAEQCFEAAIAANRRFSAAYLHLAILHRLRQQPELARQQFLKLLVIVPEEPAALAGLAEVCFELKQWEDALTWARRAQERGAPAMDAIIGMSHAALDQPAEAIRAIERSLRDDPWQPALRIKLARLHAQEENYAAALRIYEEALKMDSTSADLYLESGMMHFNMENYKNAAGAFEMAARYGTSGDADLYANLGVAYLQQAAYADAIQNLQKALQIRPSDIKIMQQLAHAFFKQQNYSQAAMQWNRILVLQPQNAFAMFMLGKSYICSGEVVKGQRICDQALQLH